MTTVLEQHKLQERPPELRIEPPAPKATPPEKQGAAPTRTGRLIRWTVVVVVLAMATSLAFLALRDDGTETTGASHPLAEVYVAERAVVQLSPVEELQVISDLADAYVAEPVETTSTWVARVR